MSDNDKASALSLINDMLRLREEYRAAAGDQYDRLMEPLREHVRASRQAGENILKVGVEACGKPGASRTAIAQICAAVMDVYEETASKDRN